MTFDASPPGQRARVAKRAEASSDVTGPGRTLWVALAAAAAAVGAVVALGTPVATSRPLSRPHAISGVACASCHSPDHDAAFARAGACATCHGALLHRARGAHASLVTDGRMTCATCHAPHDGAGAARPSGITFAKGGVKAWGTGTAWTTLAPPAGVGLGVAEGTTVPLVPLAVCAGCHEPGASSDPIARCVPATVRAALAAARSAGAREESDAARGDLLRSVASACFDEHASAVAEAAPTPSPTRVDGKPIACDAQHGVGRLVAHEAARSLTAGGALRADASSASAPAYASTRHVVAPALAAMLASLAVGLVFAGGGFHARARRRRASATQSGPGPSGPGTPTRPLSSGTTRRLPVIDAATCLGCRACVDACPFDVLAIERYVAVVARPDECCGVVLCAQVCPNGSLRIAEEGATDRPGLACLALGPDLESEAVPGLFVAGDLTGVPLVKNAIRQGVQVVDRIAATLPKRRRDVPDDIVDVLVVGAGPAGLAAALRAREKGLSCVVVEQATVAASIKSFPRDKIVHDPPLDLPVEGELWLRECTKEELVAQWTRIVRTRALDVREGHKLVNLDAGLPGPAAAFTAHLEVVSAGGALSARSVRGRRVVLAVGRRGTPRALDMRLSGSADEHVHTALVDAASFARKRVLVVGLGDSALEAIVALARQPGTVVDVSYRGTTFARGKARNVDEVKALVLRGRVRVHFGTVAVAFDGRRVRLAPASSAASASAPSEILADAVLALLGGEPPWALLERIGLSSPSPSSPAPPSSPGSLEPPPPGKNPS